jgi:hypothetical protein
MGCGPGEPEGRSLEEQRSGGLVDRGPGGAEGWGPSRDSVGLWTADLACLKGVGQAEIVQACGSRDWWSCGVGPGRDHAGLWIVGLVGLRVGAQHRPGGYG